MSGHQQRRQHYRIRFPDCECPQLQASDREYRVIDISERGAKIEFAPEITEIFALPVSVRILFRDGTEFETVASCVRHDSSGMGLCFSIPVPLAVIVKEQRRLFGRYYKD